MVYLLFEYLCSIWVSIEVGGKMKAIPHDKGLNTICHKIYNTPCNRSYHDVVTRNIACVSSQLWRKKNCNDETLDTFLM
jgi:hypothetical protein